MYSVDFALCDNGGHSCSRIANKQRKVRAVETKEEEEAGKKEEKRRAAAAASAVTRVTGTTIVALLFVFVIEFHFL